jgi:hypothetical protein
MKSAVLGLLFLTANLLSQTYNSPDILYYKFSGGSSTTTTNYATPGQGSNPVNILGLIKGPGGQFDSALVGTGGSSNSNYVNTGWNMNLGMSSWTISFWISNIGTSTNHLFGDNTTNFRCFANGSAGTGNIGIRGNNFTDVIVTGVLPGPTVIHFVYDSVTTTIKSYVNGLYQSSVVQPQLNLNSSVVFKVGGYGSASSLGAGWKMDEFRLYKRALDSVEVAATWNQILPFTIVGVTHQNNEIPKKFNLEQNYPNPFNPSTIILYSIPTEGNVELKIFNMLGQTVATLVSEFQKAGNYKATFEAANLPSGVYSYRISSGSHVETKKMILVK